MAKANKGGRPTKYTSELGDYICSELATGKPLTKICAPDDMPCTVSIYKWLREHIEFSNNYARARQDQADTYFDDAIRIADEVDADSNEIARARLRIDTRKWASGKLKPKKYGEPSTMQSEEKEAEIVDEYKLPIDEDAPKNAIL